MGCLKTNTDTTDKGNKMRLVVMVRDNYGRFILTITKERSSHYLFVLPVDLQAIFWLWKL